jgi:hypothetical protein
MFILLVRSEKIGCRLFHASCLELLLKNLDWHRQQPYLAYMADELAFVAAVVCSRPQGYVVGKVYYLSCSEKLPSGDSKHYDIHLTVDTGEWDRMMVRCLPVSEEEWKTESEVAYRTLDMVAGPNIPRTGLYHARTIYGTPICENVATLEECEALVRKYQTEVENQMCSISIELPVTQHLKTVEPYHAK